MRENKELVKYKKIVRQKVREHWKMDLKFLLHLRKILNEYHSQIPLVEVGRENVLNDIDNELKLDEKIEELKHRLKKLFGDKEAGR